MALQHGYNPTFAQVMAVAMREAANENRPVEETVTVLINYLAIAGFAIRRTYSRVDYHKDIVVLFEPGQTGISGSSYHDAQFTIEAVSAFDLRGERGFLVVWSERGRKRSEWFDCEGKSPILTDYRVANLQGPQAGVVAELKREVA